jgi:hypothetical protein
MLPNALEFFAPEHEDLGSVCTAHHTSFEIRFTRKFQI